MIASAAFYEPKAEQRGERYAKAQFEDVHAGLLNHLPPQGANVLDVGTGSGRDAYALAARGYRVTAVEPSQGMRAFALANPVAEGVRWIDDTLPDLRKVRSGAERYQFVLCSAVLMHVARPELPASFTALAELTSPGGKVAISLRPPTVQDPPEIFHEHTQAAVADAAQQAGLRVIENGHSADIFGRTNLAWDWWTFEKGEATSA